MKGDKCFVVRVPCSVKIVNSSCRQFFLMVRRSAEPDFGFDGHADAEEVVGVFALVEADADGEALDDFDEVAGGVFWREEARYRAG